MEALMQRLSGASSENGSLNLPAGVTFDVSRPLAEHSATSSAGTRRGHGFWVTYAGACAMAGRGFTGAVY